MRPIKTHAADPKQPLAPEPSVLPQWGVGGAETPGVGVRGQGPSPDPVLTGYDASS